jgi:hypothetical protein
MKVNATGVTRGREVTQTTTGVADAPVVAAGGATVTYICGRALQSGVLNDEVGVAIYKAHRITA